MEFRRFQTYYFVAIMILSLIMTLLVFRPYLAILAFGAVLAVVSRPLYKLLYKFLKSETASAFLTVIVVSLVALIPTIYFFAALAVEFRGLVGDVSGFFDADTLEKFFKRTLPESMQSNIPQVVSEAANVLRSFASRLSGSLVSLFSNVFDLVIGFLLALIMLYYLLKDGTKIKKSALAISPLNDEHDEEVLDKVTSTVRAVMYGILVVGLIKGIIAGVCYWIFSVPAPLFWGMMTGLASFLPVVGSALVTVPIIIYLVISGHTVSAVVFGIIALTAIGAMDNLLQPKLVGDQVKIHPLLILLAMLGGFSFYGFSGFVLGPLTLAVTLALLEIYRKEFKGKAE
jgi:predicted PurR-regulated permease PerM